MTYRKTYLAAGISALALACPFAASAQTAPPEREGSVAADEKSRSDNDIIVTATRREESVLDVPLSVQAYSQESLDQKGVRNIEDLARITPGLSLSQGFSGIKYIAIRGLSSSVGATMTGVYLDDTPIQVRSLVLSTNFYPALYDLERVEVLRGPQGTLFGAGAMGGAVRFILAKPSLTEYSGNMRGEMGITEGGDWSWEAGGAVGGPIVQDKIGFRVSANYRRDGGYIDRVPFVAARGTREEDSNSGTTFVANAALTFAPTDNLTITPSVFFQQVDRHDASTYWTWREDSPRPDLPVFQSGEGIPSWGKDRAALYSVKAELNLGGVSLISNSAITDRKASSRDDSTAYLIDVFQGSIGPTWNFLFGGLGFGQYGVGMALPNAAEATTINLAMTQKAFTQELRLQSNDNGSPLKYVFGLFYQNSRQTSLEHDFAPNTGGLPYLFLFPTGPDGLLSEATGRTRDRQYAAFGQIDYELLEGLTVSAGVRVSRIEFDYYATSEGVFGGDGTPETGSTKETPVTPKFGIEYQVSPNLMLYGSVAKGFRSGGVNTGADNASCDADLEELGYSSIPRSYKSDSVWSYEVGAKGRIGRFATFQASAFNIDWSDIQRTRSLLSCTTVFTENFGKARSRGFEAQVTLTPAAGLSFDIGVGYADATQRQTIFTLPAAPVQGTILRNGDRFATPWVVNLAADYEAELGSGDLRGYGHVQYDYKSGWSVKPGNVGFNAVFANNEAQNLVSARAGVRSGPVDVSLFVNNLFDERPVIGRLNFSPAERVQIQTYRPRTWGITAGYRF
jgi:outer membrane receptor protein involved in Fe transport